MRTLCCRMTSLQCLWIFKFFFSEVNDNSVLLRLSAKSLSYSIVRDHCFQAFWERFSGIEDTLRIGNQVEWELGSSWLKLLSWSLLPWRSRSLLPLKVMIIVALKVAIIVALKVSIIIASSPCWRGHKEDCKDVNKGRIGDGAGSGKSVVERSWGRGGFLRFYRKLLWTVICKERLWLFFLVL